MHVRRSGTNRRVENIVDRMDHRPVVDRRIPARKRKPAFEFARNSKLLRESHTPTPPSERRSAPPVVTGAVASFIPQAKPRRNMLATNLYATAHFAQTWECGACSTSLKGFRVRPQLRPLQMRSLRVVSIALALGALTAPAWAANSAFRADRSQVWEQFRHGGGLNDIVVNRDLPDRLAWRFSIPSKGTSASPVVAGGLVLVASNDHSLYAVDARSGKPVWQWKGDNQVMSAPVYRDGITVVGTGNGDSPVWDPPAYNLVGMGASDLNGIDLRTGARTLDVRAHGQRDADARAARQHAAARRRQRRLACARRSHRRVPLAAAGLLQRVDDESSAERRHRVFRRPIPQRRLRAARLERRHALDARVSPPATAPSTIARSRPTAAKSSACTDRRSRRRPVR